MSMADDDLDPQTGVDEDNEGEQLPEPNGEPNGDNLQEEGDNIHGDNQLGEGENIHDNAVVFDADNLYETTVDSDGEDPVERNEYEIAVVIGEFQNDEQVRHDVYYESGSESDEESESRRERKRKFTPRSDGILFKGQKFFNGIAFKETVLHYALKNKRNIRQERYDKSKISFVCLGKEKSGARCGWRVYCSARKGSANWKIRMLTDNHSCEKTGICSLLKVQAIARMFVDRIRDDPEHFMPMVIEDLIFRQWGVSVTRNQVQAARVKALKWIEAEYDDQFKRLRDYGNELLVSNPGSTVEIDCMKGAKGEDVFDRFYVCFDSLKKCWKSSCRPLLGIDGAFMKSKVKGQLFVALGRDSDNKIYPVAWGVVGVENADNWGWFLKKVQADLDLKDGEGYVIISDRQKGLISAVSSELPRAEHRHCVRHIYGNMKKKFGKREPMKKFVWDLAWSYNETEFKERLKDIENFDDDVFEYVINSEPRSWCRAFYKLGPCCEDVENNSTESFNRTVVKAREKPFVPMLETIRTLAMTRIGRRNKEIEDHKGILTPYATEILELEEEMAAACTLKASIGGMYEASISGCSHRVSLERKTCTCRKWQIRGIPCEHAYGVILKKKLFVEEYVSGWFHTEVWKKNYELGITPPRGARFWPRGSLPPINYPHYAEEKEKKDKEGKKRKRGKNESPTKKRKKEDKRVMHCGVCGMAGHNSRFHKKDKEQAKGGGKQDTNQVKGGKKQAQGGKKQAQGSKKQAQGGKKQAQGGKKQAQGGKKQAQGGPNLHAPD